MKKIRWLHISDLHFGLDNYFIGEMRRKMKPYIEEHLMNEKFHYLFVTGDLKYSKTCKDYPKDCSDFINSLCDTIGVQKDKVFIVCGNHDVERINARKDVCAGILSDYKKNIFKIDESRYKVLKDSQSKFTKYLNSITEYEINKKTQNSPHYVIQDENVNILFINSAITSCDDGERGKLLIGREFLQKQMKNINTNKPAIALAHHPFDWFEKEEAEQLESILKDYNVSLYLCGHQHVADAGSIKNINQTKELYEIACGTLIDEVLPFENSEMGFSIGEIDIEDGAGTIQAYKYQKKFNGWHKDNTFAIPQNNETGDFKITIKKK